MEDRYSREERRAVAAAWKEATGDDALVGADQGSAEFREKMLKALKKEYPDAKEKYWHRGADKIYMYWRDDIAKDISQFLFVLREAQAAITTGNLSEDQLNGIAVAKHLNKTTVCTYNYKDVDPDEWLNYRAFLVVQDEPKFQLNPGARRPSVASEYTSGDDGDDGDESSSPNVGHDDAAEDEEEVPSDADGAIASPHAHTKAKRTACASVASKANSKRRSADANTHIPYKPTGKQNKKSRRGTGRDNAREKQKKEEQRKDRKKRAEDIQSLAEKRMKQKNDEMKLRLLHMGLAANKDKDEGMSEKCRVKVNELLTNMFEEEEKEESKEVEKEKEEEMNGEEEEKQEAE